MPEQATDTHNRDEGSGKVGRGQSDTSPETGPEAAPGTSWSGGSLAFLTKAQGASKASMLVGLQRSVGNRQVQRLLHTGGRANSNQAIGPRTAAGASGAAREQVVQRFESHEHKEIGELAETGELDIDIGGRKLTHGEMIALAGDYFGSLDEIKRLAETEDGKAKLRWTVWFAFHEGSEPPLAETAKKEIRDRYFKLAGDNVGHFGAGGQAKNLYREYHLKALELAFFAGATVNDAKWQDARLNEAFGHHFLTDLFSSGHVRTPREEIDQWYNADPNFSNSLTTLVNYMAKFVLKEIYREAGDTSHSPILEGGKPTKEFTSTTGFLAEVFKKEADEPLEKVKVKIRDMGGAALEAFSLADIVALAYHDEDNKGLFVVSDADPSGNLVPGGYRWLAKGDGHLDESPETQLMVTAALKESMQELDLAREAGLQASNGQSMPEKQIQAAFNALPLSTPPYGAEKFIPREDKGDLATTNLEMQWKWGHLNDIMYNAIDGAVKGKIAYQLGTKAPSAPMIEQGYHLHVDKAVTSLAKHLKTQGIRVLEDALGIPAR